MVSQRVEAIRTAIDDKHPSDNTHRIFSVVKSVDELMNNFKLTPAEMDEVVELTQSKLEEILTHIGYGKSSSNLGSLNLYKQENERTKSVIFYANDKEKKVDIIPAEIMDSSEDHQMRQSIRKKMEKFMREKGRRAGASRLAAEKLVITD